MATIPKERRSRKGVDMASMIALLDRFGPDARRRASMEEQEMRLKQDQFGLAQSGQQKNQEYIAAQIAAMQAAQERAAADAVREQSMFEADQARRAQLDPLQLALMSSQVGGALQQQQGFEQGQRFAANADERAGQKQTAEIQQIEQAMKLAPIVAGAQSRAANTSFLGEVAAFSQQDPRFQVSPEMASTVGMQLAPKPPDPAEFLNMVGQQIQSDPAQALRTWGAAPPNLQALIPFGPDERVQAAAGVTPETLMKLFKVAKPQVQAPQQFPMFQGWKAGLSNY